jgi:hypothetical protein
VRQRRQLAYDLYWLRVRWENDVRERRRYLLSIAGGEAGTGRNVAERARGVARGPTPSDPPPEHNDEHDDKEKLDGDQRNR